MRDDDFDDAFADDEAAELERSRRRARRAAERRERLESGSPPPAAEPPSGEPPIPAAPDEGRAATQDSPAIRAEPPAAGAVPPAAAPPAASPPGAAGERPHVAAARRRRGTSGPTLWIRRGAGLAALIALALLAYVGVTAIAGALGGGESQELGQGAGAAEPKGPTVDVVVPEGLDRSQIAEVSADAGLEGDYEKASESVAKDVFDPAAYGARDPESLEGFLFPATYEIPKRQASADELVAQQLGAFRDYFQDVDMRYAESKNLTPYDVVIIASMIEREVSVAKERPLVAAVIYNRLSQGIPLGIDATTRFAVGNYDSPLTESELAVDSPYNTRTNAGLPPGPIGNPGLASLKAAAKPAKVDYTYYVVEPGTCNRHVFTNSQEEFDQAVAEYQAALEEQGGSPTTC